MIDPRLQPLFDHLNASFPIDGPLLSLELVPETQLTWPTPQLIPGLFEDPRGNLRVILRLFCYDPGPDQTRSITDIKEQECLLVLDAHRAHPHLIAYLDGWTQALQHVIAQGDPAYFSTLMPSDLVCYDALHLKKPRTAQDFAAALLGSRRRLGHALPPAAP